MIDWDKASKEEYLTVNRIADRAVNELGSIVKKGDLSMDIMAVHVSCCPLMLQNLLDAALSDFQHDIFGIIRHIDRTNGQLQDCFLPRFAV